MWGSRKRAFLSVAVLSAADFLVWLGWDRERTVGSDGYLHGPYETWQVVGVIVVLGALAAVSGLHGHTVGAAWASAIGVVVAFLVAAPSDGNGLSFVGVVLLAIGTFLGFWAVASVGRRASRWIWRDRS